MDDVVRNRVDRLDRPRRLEQLAVVRRHDDDPIRLAVRRFIVGRVYGAAGTEG
jgi:hypothetical protein